MKYIILLSLLFSSSTQKEEWACFVTNIKDPSCGAIGYSKSRVRAIQEAFKKCDIQCGSVCYLEYCEKRNEKQ